jgi:hypothetical protein
LRALPTVLILVTLAPLGAQAPDALLSETRLTVPSLVREDVFAGFLENNLARLTQAEANIEKLLQQRPGQRANLLAWRSGAALYRAVVAHEAGKAEEFRTHFTAAQAGFAEAVTLAMPHGPGNDGVHAIRGGSNALYADRLPAEHRAAAWTQAWESYSFLWKGQAAGIADMPVHLKGELLAGLAQSAQRTGRTAETTEFLDRMLEHLPNTPYEPMAKQWKADPAAAASTNLTCKNCHNPGKLAARVKALQ